MKLFRNKKNGLLYFIFHIRHTKFTGRWYEAYPYKHDEYVGHKRPGKFLPKNVIINDLDDFEPVAEYGKVDIA